MEKAQVAFMIVAPKLPQGLEKIELPHNNIEDEFTLSAGIVADCSLENQRAEQTVIKQIIFQNVVFRECSFQRIELIDVRFEDCDLSNTDLVKRSSIGWSLSIARW